MTTLGDSEDDSFNVKISIFSALKLGFNVETHAPIGILVAVASSKLSLDKGIVRTQKKINWHK